MSLLQVEDVTWDGSHFTAESIDGLLEGHGMFSPDTGTTGGTIVGFIQNGPSKYRTRYVSIQFSGQHGVCRFS